MDVRLISITRVRWTTIADYIALKKFGIVSVGAPMRNMSISWRSILHANASSFARWKFYMCQFQIQWIYKMHDFYLFISQSDLRLERFSSNSVQIVNWSTVVNLHAYSIPCSIVIEILQLIISNWSSVILCNQNTLQVYSPRISVPSHQWPCSPLMPPCRETRYIHYCDVIMSALASQITRVSIVCPTACSGLDQRKHQSSTSLAFVRGIHRSPGNSPHKGPVTRKMFPLDDVSMRRTHAHNHHYVTGLELPSSL